MGQPAELFFDLQNAGRENWPATFIWFEEGADNLDVNSAQLGQIPGERVELANASVYRFAGLNAGEQKRVRFTLTLTQGEGIDPHLALTVWGDVRNRQALPPGIDEFRQVLCSPTIVSG